MISMPWSVCPAISPIASRRILSRLLKRDTMSVLCAVLLLAIQGQAQQSLLTRHLREAALNGQAQPLGHLPATQVMQLDIVLPLSDQAGLDAFLSELYDPASPSYRRFLTVPEFTSKFGPSQANYDAVVAFAKARGLTVVGGTRDGMDVQVKGPVSAIESAFHVNLRTYQHPTENRVFYAPDREPTGDLPFRLWHISGLDNYSIPHSMLVSKSDYAQAHGIAPGDVVSHATTGSGPSASFLGSDMRAAYYGGASLTGTGQNLGLWEYEGTDLADLNTYFTNIGQTNNVPVTLVSTDGTSTNCVVASGCDDTEQTIDMTQAIGMAPGLSSLVMYIGSYDTTILSAMTAPPNQIPLPTTVGCSWGWTPADPSALDPYFERMAAQGQNFFVASGDRSTWSSSNEAWPADDANVVSVGGTDLVTASAGGAWQSETAWADSGGGISPDSIAIPAWQQLPGVINSGNKGSTTLRNGPDVSANANFTFYTCADQTTCQANEYGGTSFAAPMWAGYIALVNQQLAANGEPTVGFLNPLIYAQNVTFAYNTDFHDITSGTSGSYSAVAGYDLVTGWGSPNGQGLINALVGPPVSGFTLSASPGSLSISTGGTGTTTITVNDLAGFTGSVNLSLSGLPSGVTASFSPNPTTGTSVLTFTASNLATTTTSTINVTGVSGSQTEGAYLSLAVANSVQIAAPPSANFGEVNIGSTSPAIPMVFTFTTPGTIGGEAVLTQGAIGLDFANAGSGSCTANTAYSAGQTCTVNTTFTPRLAGTRFGAVVLEDNSGNTLAIGHLQGVGAGPQINFLPGAQSTVGSGFRYPDGVAVDGSGDIYVADQGHNAVYELLAVNGAVPASPTIVALGSGFSEPAALAVDGSGNVYVADTGNSAIKEIVAVNGSIPASPTIRTLGSGFKYPAGVAVDGSGNVYVADTPSAIKEIIAVNGSIPASPAINMLASGFSYPGGVAVDGNGNVYVSDSGHSAVKEILAVNGSIPTSPTIETLGGGFNYPYGIAVDGSGNVYVADWSNNAVYKILAVNGTIPASPIIGTLGGGFSYPADVSLDGRGNVYVADYGNERAVKLDFADPPSLSFASTAVGSTSTDSPQTVTIQNVGNAALSFPNPSAGNNPSIAANFTLNSNGVSACPLLTAGSSTPGTLAVGASCQLPISFAPTAPGALTGSLVLTDNNLNAAAPGYTTQSIALSGTGAFVLTASPASLTVYQGSSNTSTITVTGATGSVSLAASGLPYGVTASFTPNPATGTSTLTLTAAVYVATPGTYNLTITGTAGAQTAKTTLVLTVATPGFTVSSAISSAAFFQGSSLTSTITVLPASGFSGSVTLAASGLPAGVTASFSPNPTATTSVLTLTASSTAALVQTFVTISGTSGAETATCTIDIEIVAPSPSFTLGLAPSSLGIPQGSSAASTVSVIALNGFNSSVNLAAYSLPSGVTASFSPNPTTGTSLLTLTASSAAPTGTYGVIIAGTQGPGWPTESTTLAVSITAPAGFSPSSANLGAVNIGTTSPVQSFAYTFGAAVTLGSTAMLTQGATGLDFADAGSDTCTANTAYSTGQSCIVNVSFTPKFAGTRYGAVALYDNNGNAIATGYLQGTGVGPQLNFLPAAESFPASGFNLPTGLAVDSSGNLFVADFNNFAVKEVLAVNGSIPSSPTINTLGSGFGNPTGVAIDGSGNVFVADYSKSAVYEVLKVGGYTTVIALGGGFSNPWGVAVDGSGNVYVTDSYNNAVKQIPPGCFESTCVITLGSGFSSPNGVAVDSSGNVFVTDSGNNALKEILAAGGYITINTITSGLPFSAALAVAGNGNLYVADTTNNTVLELSATDGYATVNTLAAGFGNPYGITVDGAGNVYVADSDNNRVAELNYANPPALSFANAAVGSTSTDSPQTVTVENAGNAALSFPVPLTGNNPSIAANFTLNSSGASACPLLSSSSSTPGTLAAGASCLLPISFSPTAAGALSGSLVLTDNNLNAAAPTYTSQTIALSATGTQSTPTITWPTPPPITFGTPLSATQLGATSTVAGTFAYSPPAGTVLTAGQQTLTVTFVPTDSTDYSTATASVTLTVNQATPVITWLTSAAITYGTALSAMQLNASTPVAGAFTYSPAAGAVLTAGQQTLTVTFVPTDSTDYTTATASVTLTVNQSTPTITWATPAAITYGTALSGTQLNATSPVAGTFNYSPAAGTVLTAGQQTLTVIFAPTDSTDYTTATASVTLTVNQATPTINWPTPASITYGAALSSTQLNASSTVAGTLTYSPAAGTVLTAGSHTLSVTFAPTDTTDYTNASASVTLTVNQATPTINWPTPAAITYGRALSATQLNASSTIAGSFTYSPAAGTVLNAGTQTLTVSFAPTDTTDYKTASDSVTQTVNKAVLTIAWATPAAITYGTALSATQLDASSTAAGTFAYSPAAGTVLAVGSHTLTVTLTPTDAANYTTATATATVTLTVSKATPTIAWATPTPITYGTALSATQLDASSTVAGTFTYSPAAKTVLSAGSQTLSVTFAPTNTTDYTTATDSVTLTVSKAAPTITWATPAAITYGTALSPTQLNANSSVAGTFTYSPATGTVLTAGSQTLSVAFAPTNATDYATAADSVTLTVNKAAPTVKLTSSASSVSSGTSVTFTATLTGRGVKPTGTVTFLDGTTKLGTGTLNGSGVATLATSTLAVGKHSITASYGGDGNYLTATSTAITVTVTAK